MKKYVTPLSIVLAIVFLAIAIYYWSTPAGSLPHFVPGYEAGSKHIHLKHGLAAIILAFGCSVLAWFWSGKSKQPTTTPTSTSDTTKS